MKNSKYLVFISIGFELVGLVLLGIYGGEYLVKKGAPEFVKALLIVFVFILWFISLIIKLRKIDKKWLKR